MMKKSLTIKILVILVFICSAWVNAAATLSLNSLFGDGMVLQRNTKVAIWGSSASNEKLSITTSWNGKKYEVTADKNGYWKVYLTTEKTGGPFSITVLTAKEKKELKDILLGEVWICSGQSNMDMPVIGFTNQHVNQAAEILDDAEQEQIRLFKVQQKAATHPLNAVTGFWKKASYENVSGFSAVGYLFAKRLHSKLGVPMGIIQSAWGGTKIESWISANSLVKFKNSPFADLSHPKNKPSSLYNGMIAPLIGFTIKGIIWYQGESNRTNADEYLELFPEMVRDWRETWRIGDFPFYYVQIAPYNYVKDGKQNWWLTPYMREIQEKCLTKIPNSAMVVTIDIGNQVSIHPPEKKEVALRLSNIALNNLYDVKGSTKFPSYKEHVISGNKILLKFANAARGLTSNYNTVTLFEIAGADSVFYNAQARIVNSGIEVSSDKVKTPVAVRYAYKPFVKGEVFSTVGLPLAPFRTDNWKFN